MKEIENIFSHSRCSGTKSRALFNSSIYKNSIYGYMFSYQ